MPKQGSGLEIEQDSRFQQREWQFQRVGWWALSAFVAAAALGLFGSGPLSRAEAGDSRASLWIEYERFVRVGAPTRIVIHVNAPQESGATELRINREYFDALRVEHITPQPSRMAVGEQDVRLAFDGEGTQPAAASIAFDMEPLSPGRQSARIGAGGATPVAFTQFAYF
jgi:hypothetical protein